MIRSKGEKLAADAIFLLISKVLASLSMIIIFVILSYYFTVTQYGQFRIVWLLNKTLVLELFAFGIPISIYYFLKRMEPSRKKLFVVQSLFLLSLSGFIAFSGVFIFAERIADFYENAELAEFLRILCLYPLFILPTLALESVLITEGRPITFAVYSILDRFLLMVASFIVVLLFDNVFSLCLLFLVFGFLELIASLVLITHATRRYPLSLRTSNVVEQIKFAVPAGMANVIDVLRVELDKLVVSSYFSIQQFAIYANGAFEIPIVGTIASSISAVLTPEYVESYKNGDYREILRIWHASICKVALIFYPLMVYLYVFAEEFVTLVFSNAYTQSVPIFQIYLIALMPKVTWYSVILIACGKSGDVMWAAIISLSSNLVLNLILIKLIGFHGPAYATVMTVYVLVVFYLFRIKILLNVGWLEVFPWKNLGIILLISLLLGAVIFNLVYSIEAGRFTLLTIGFLAYVFPILVVFRLMNFITCDDISFLRRFLRIGT